MLMLLSIFSVCAIGFALILGAVFIGRLLHLVFIELRANRLSVEKLVIAERQKADLLTKIVVELYDERKRRNASGTQNAPQ